MLIAATVRTVRDPSLRPLIDAANGENVWIVALTPRQCEIRLPYNLPGWVLRR
eukprot:SAG31_NODE_11982_length_980_cov_1.140749_2_plen_52_part_01